MEECVESVKDYKELLKDVENQTEQLCLEAVKHNGYLLAFVKEQTEQICLEAVKNKGKAICYVREQTREICLAAVRNTGLALEDVKEQTVDICIEAIKEAKRDALMFVDKSIYDEVCKQMNLLYLPGNGIYRDLLIILEDGERKCYIGCQRDLSIEALLSRIYNTDGGLKTNPHRQAYLDFLKENGLL